MAVYQCTSWKWWHPGQTSLPRRASSCSWGEFRAPCDLVCPLARCCGKSLSRQGHLGRTPRQSQWLRDWNRSQAPSWSVLGPCGRHPPCGSSSLQQGAAWCSSFWLAQTIVESRSRNSWRVPHSQPFHSQCIFACLVSQPLRWLPRLAMERKATVWPCPSTWSHSWLSKYADLNP